MSALAAAGARSRESTMTVSPVLDQHETAAADTRRLRLDHVERELYRCGGIDGVAALRQHAGTGSGGGRMRDRHHTVGRGGQDR
jgi:hypothetical protein